jgi:3-hydroxymyristoyl/3-hydroxydecanoyl-(acyl carrier protein) dehydratase
MAFHYVDRIYEYTPFKSIKGIKNVTRNEPFSYWLPTGERVLSPAVILEAMAQLGSWLNMVSTDFTRRPVLLADELTEYLGQARPGDQIDMDIQVMDFGDDVIVTKGTASVHGKPILIGHCCRGYLLPLEEFDDPKKIERQWKQLYRPEFADTPRYGTEGAVPDRADSSHHPFDGLRFVDGIIEHERYKKVVAFKNFSSCETFFETHFPFKPIVPGVLQTTFLAEVSQYLLRSDIEMPLRQRALVPKFIRNVRFRKYLEPGDQATIEVKVIDGDASKDNSEIIVKAMIKANGKRVMVAEMGFNVMYSPKIESFTRHLDLSEQNA